jgi:hypothetical protein
MLSNFLLTEDYYGDRVLSKEKNDMPLFSLNHDRIKKKMRSNDMTFQQLAKLLSLKSRQMAHYIATKGGVNYAEALAKVFRCDPRDLIVSAKFRTPRRIDVVRGKVKKH